MQFTKTIIYVSDVAATLAFFEQAFGVATRNTNGSSYGELEIGGTTLVFATAEAGAAHLPETTTAAPSATGHVAFEIAFVADDVEAAFQRAIDAGATAIQTPEVKPWGQTVSHLAGPDGIVIDLSSPAPTW